MIHSSHANAATRPGRNGPRGGDPGLTALLTLIDEALSAVAGHTIVSASDISDRLLDIRLAAEKQ